MNRDNIVFLIIATDILVVLCYMIFIEFLDFQQNHFLEEFADQTIEMNDFSVRIENMPGFEYHRGDETTLKMKLWCHINFVIQKQLKYENKFTN